MKKTPDLKSMHSFLAGCFALVCFFFSGPCAAAIALVQASPQVTTAAATSVAAVFTAKPTVGNKIVVVAWTFNASAVTLSATDSAGNVYTSAAQKSIPASGFQATAIFFSTVNATSPLLTVTIAGGTAGAQIEAVALEYSGVGALDLATTASGTTNVIAINSGVSTSSANELVISAMSLGSPAVLFSSLASASATQRAIQLNNSGNAAGQGNEKIVTTTGIQSQTWTPVTSKGTFAWVAAMATFRASAPLPDHYEINVPSSGVSCLSSPVTITACSVPTTPGASCTSPYTAVSGSAVSLSTTAGSFGSSNPLFNAAGVASTTLSYPLAVDGAVAAVSLSAVPAPPLAASQCCPGGSSCFAATSCPTAFKTAGFLVSNVAGGSVFTLPTQTAGSSSSNTSALFLRAVKTSTLTQACEPALTGPSTVNWSVQCNNPGTCATGPTASLMSLSGNSTTAIGSNPIAAGTTPASSVSMTFDANGNAPLSFNHADVGQVTLYATKPASGTLLTALSGATNAFVVKPAGFVLSSIQCTTLSAGNCAPSRVAAGSASNPGAVSASSGAFIQAGANFSATVTATITGGAAAPSYGKESPAESVKLTSTRLLPPSGGAAPTLTNPASFGAFTAGSATSTVLQWGEVGIINLTPSVIDANYLGVGDVTGTTSGNVGRFIPAQFASAPVASCAAGSPFTYSGQSFGYTLTARNALGATTVNYDASSGFSKTATLTAQGALPGALSAASTPSTSFLAGAATFNAASGPVYTYTAKKTSPSTLTVRALDSDQVSSDPLAPSSGVAAVESSLLVRSGQLRVYGASGGDKAALSVPLALQYWSGSSWLTNTDDSCTTLTASNIALTSPSNAAAVYVAGVPTFSMGVGSVSVTPSSTSGSAAGSVALAIDLGASGVDQSCQTAHGGNPALRPWLRSFFGSCSVNADRDPSASLGFGIYTTEAKRQIYVREMR